jgi:hypothetical protein
MRVTLKEKILLLQSAVPKLKGHHRLNTHHHDHIINNKSGNSCVARAVSLRSEPTFVLC